MEHKGVVLVVEDDPGILRATKGALELEGYTAHTAMSVRQARAVLAEAEPDAILLDVGLPDGSGLDFCREIREQTAAYIVILTAGAARKREVLLCGGDSLIRKPYHFGELFGLLALALSTPRAVRNSS